MRIKRLEIENFKCIDQLELDFPKPDFKNEPDVFVIGSRNGVGKTSVLEAIALNLFRTITNSKEHPLIERKLISAGKYVRSGTTELSITTEVEVESNIWSFKERNGNSTNIIKLFARHSAIIHNQSNALAINIDTASNEDLIKKIYNYFNWGEFCYNNSSPMLSPFLLYFHSYRHVALGIMSLSDLTSNDSSKVPNFFKETMINLILGKHGLFEGKENDNDAYEKLNLLINKYANGEISKFGNPNGNSLELKIKLKNSEESIPFDLLSSGQKEIISTLFTIWYHTREYPCIVLIDEPELHLNPAWKYTLVDTLYELAPQNQYILATHSKEIFESVDESKRIVLEK